MSKPILYHADISAVDGERFYGIVTPDPREALAFLERYDHEGSAVAVNVSQGEYDLFPQSDGENAYVMLRASNE